MTPVISSGLIAIAQSLLHPFKPSAQAPVQDPVADADHDSTDQLGACFMSNSTVFPEKPLRRLRKVSAASADRGRAELTTARAMFFLQIQLGQPGRHQRQQGPALLVDQKAQKPEGQRAGLAAQGLLDLLFLSAPDTRGFLR